MERAHANHVVVVVVCVHACPWHAAAVHVCVLGSAVVLHWCMTLAAVSAAGLGFWGKRRSCQSWSGADFLLALVSVTSEDHGHRMGQTWPC